MKGAERESVVQLAELRLRLRHVYSESYLQTLAQKVAQRLASLPQSPKFRGDDRKYLYLLLLQMEDELAQREADLKQLLRQMEDLSLESLSPQTGSFALSKALERYSLEAFGCQETFSPSWQEAQFGLEHLMSQSQPEKGLRELLAREQALAQDQDRAQDQRQKPAQDQTQSLREEGQAERLRAGSFSKSKDFPSALRRLLLQERDKGREEPRAEKLIFLALDNERQLSFFHLLKPLHSSQTAEAEEGLQSAHLEEGKEVNSHGNPSTRRQ